MGIRDENQQMEKREQMVIGVKKHFFKKQTSLLKREYYRDEIRGINPYIIRALPAQKQRNSALRWSLTVKTTFRLFSMSISLGNPLLPQRTR